MSENDRSESFQSTPGRSLVVVNGGEGEDHGGLSSDVETEEKHGSVDEARRALVAVEEGQDTASFGRKQVRHHSPYLTRIEKELKGGRTKWFLGIVLLL